MFFCSLIFISGCTQLSSYKTDSTDASATISSWPSNWQTKGKIAIHVQAQSTNEKTSTHVLRYDWTQIGENYTIGLSGAFGLGSMIIQRNDERITLSRGQQLLAEAGNADQLFYQHTGLTLPVSLLRHWITGVPGPDLPTVSTHNFSAPVSDAAALPELKGFAQAGWTVRYAKTEQHGNLALPKKMMAQSPRASLSVAVASWHLGPRE
jgi:outer membrane lipoprotein LolB